MTPNSGSIVPVPVAAIVGGVVGGVLISFLLVIPILLLVLKWRTKTFSIQGIHVSQSLSIAFLMILLTQAAHNPQEDIDLHDYDDIDYETAIETKECAAYAVQKKVDLESNPAYIYAQVQVADQVTTVEMRECVAYGNQETVTTGATPAYQTVTIEMKECDAYGTQETVTTEANAAYQTVTAHS